MSDRIKKMQDMLGQIAFLQVAAGKISSIIKEYRFADRDYRNDIVDDIDLPAEWEAKKEIRKIEKDFYQMLEDVENASDTLRRYDVANEKFGDMENAIRDLIYAFDEEKSIGKEYREIYRSLVGKGEKSDEGKKLEITKKAQFKKLKAAKGKTNLAMTHFSVEVNSVEEKVDLSVLVN